VDYNHASTTLIKVLLQRGYNRRNLQRLKMQIWNNYSVIPKRDNLEEALNPPEIIPIDTPFHNFHAPTENGVGRLVKILFLRRPVL